ncbi:hypothetical protein GmHk_16G045988 [Glycine max]|nr:hypothetical protein GmHk_16G045988 [Glycine max]
MLSFSQITKGRYVDPSGQDPNIDILDRHRLYVDDIFSHLVALGRAYEGLPTIQHVPLANDMVKVLNTFIAWSKHLVNPFSENVFPFCVFIIIKKGIKWTKEAVDRPKPDDDPIYQMNLIIPQLFLKPMQVLWDATMFGVYNDNIPLNIKHEDLREITHGGQCLNIAVLKFWIM